MSLATSGKRKRKRDEDERESRIKCSLQLILPSFGITALKKEQEQAIIAFVEDRDVFVCLPTGFGKSLCYFILPRLFNMLQHSTSKMAVVVSPLVALMSDQVEILKSKGVNAAICTNKGSDIATKKIVLEGKNNIIFTNPETLFDKDWTDVWRSSSVSERIISFVVDEAHCVKKWGKEFRKEFNKLGELRSFFPSNLRFMALTATASKSTRNAVIRILGMQKPVVIVRSPNKANIVYSVSQKEDDLEATFRPLLEELRSLRQLMDKTIIFCRTYQDCSELFLYFRSSMGVEFTNPSSSFPDHPCFRLVDMFTACNTPTLKQCILKSFLEPDGNLRIVIATIAFGMGIDCPDVHRIIHWGPPSDVESYIQETGRGGRDGKLVQAKLYYSNRDISLSFMEESMVSYCKNSSFCRRKILFQDFDGIPLVQEEPTGSKCCDICAMSKHVL